MTLELTKRESDFPTVLVRGGFLSRDLSCVENGYYAELLTRDGEILRARVIGRLGDEFAGVVERIERYDVNGARRLVLLSGRSEDVRPGGSIHFRLDQVYAFIEAEVCAARDRRQAVASQVAVAIATMRASNAA